MQRHRGQHPEDAKLFAEKTLPTLQEAVQDLSWLLSRDYPDNPSLQLVGNRFRLTERQMIAVMRCACSEQAREKRAGKEISIADIAGKEVSIDGYNLLITLESALSGGVILLGRDNCYRDLASIHRTYRKVEETLPALMMIGEALQELGIHKAQWYFDSPVSNSGRLKGIVTELAQERGWDWQTELVFNPDKVLIESSQVVITSDSWILDECGQWFNMLDFLLTNKVADVNLKDFRSV
ncbi:MAG: DUF434 domain-containing protein [Bacteroidetes bacterium]|nr:MAG: DUF434 domain-containing protein [Bacteroidota bacterium]